MIAFLRGTVSTVEDSVAVLDVGGIGVQVVPTARCLASLRVGQVVTVSTVLVMREDQWTIFGFADRDERSCFQAMQAAKGIGPRVAIGLLGALTPDQLRRAVSAGDARTLTAAPGVGTKSAQRLIIDLRDK